MIRTQSTLSNLYRTFHLTAGLIILSFLLPCVAFAQSPSSPGNEAFLEYSDRALRSDNKAYFPLAQMYATGRGTPRDLVEAYALAEIASVVLDEIEDTDNDRARALKAQLAPQMLPEQINLALKRASERRPDLEWLRGQDKRDTRMWEAVLWTWAATAVVGAVVGLAARRLLFRHWF